ncbi:hypothetical protein [uncultured Gimesia sp.]|uniref:hypothetical protein n=1 Tax=uncultured Gimesia sp. TaxID=1678688 RepID=UPI0030DA9100
MSFISQTDFQPVGLSRHLIKMEDRRGWLNIEKRFRWQTVFSGSGINLDELLI